MKFKSKVFKADFDFFNDENIFHFINIIEIDTSLKELLDQNIAEICYGNPDRNIDIVKKRLLRRLNGDIDHVMGSISEFLAIVYLKEIGFKQEFLFLNLEENSAKKGFDGFYTKDKEYWVFESKSGDSNSAGGTHKEKLSLAYRDLLKTIEGKDKKKNNIWENALNHYKIVNRSNNDSLEVKLTQMSDNFELGIYEKIENHNIIPASTIFIKDNFSRIDSKELSKWIQKYFIDEKFKRINIICINKKSANMFINYLNS